MSKDLILDSMLRLPLSRVPKDIRGIIEQQHTVRVSTGSTSYGPPQDVEAYRYENGYLCLPRQAPDALDFMERYTHVDRRSHGSPLELQWQGDYRVGQKSFVHDAVRSIRANDDILAKAPCGFGKCLSPETWISTDKGLVRLGSLVPQASGEGAAAFGVETEIGLERAAKTWAEIEKPALSVSLANGFQLIGSYVHRVRVVTEHGIEWRMLQSLQEGDAVLLRRTPLHGSPVSIDWVDQTDGRHAICPPKQMTRGLARILGYLVADGDLSRRRRTGFTKSYPEVSEDFVQLVSELGDFPIVRDGIEHLIHSVGFVSLLDYLGLKRGVACQKVIPWSILESGEECIREFLATYLDCDSGVSSDTAIVEVCSASQTLAEQVQLLLFNMGFNPNLKTKVVDGVNYWRVLIYRDELPEFQRQFNYRTQHKREALARVLQRLETRTRKNPNHGLWPITALMRALYKEGVKRKIGVWRRMQGTPHKLQVEMRHNPTRAGVLSFLSLLPELEDSSLYQSLFRLAFTPEFDVVPVDNVTAVGTQRLVDLEVPGSHTYVANGIVGHNTVTATAIMARLGVTALVGTHKKALMEQWVRACQTFLGVTPGIVRGPDCDFRDKPIVIAMIQSLAQKTYPKEFYTWPGLTVWDECHRVSAPTFSYACSQFPSRYRLGLTATPRRGDGTADIFRWHLGEVAVRGRGAFLDCIVWGVKTGVVIPEGLYSYRGKPHLSKLITKLTEHEKRTSMIVRAAIKAVRKGRRLLILTHRVKHVEEMVARLNALFQTTGEPYTAGNFKAGTSKKATRIQEAAAQCTVTVATWPMASEGLDVPDKDTLLMATPTKDPEQAAGRIRRIFEDKRDPMIVDFIDAAGICWGLWRHRWNYYRSAGDDKNPWQVNMVE